MYGMAGVSRPVDVYAEDDWTVVLKTPPGQLGKCWEFVSDWTRHFPKEVIDKYGDHNDWENVTGTGGFVLVDFVPMSSVVWERNPNYWMDDPVIPGNQLPYVDKLTELIIPDRSTQLAALRTAKVDWSYSYGFPTEDGEQLINTAPDLENLIYPESSFRNLGFRQDKPELPFYDVNVRRALLMAVNQQEIIDTYYGGQGQIAPQIVMNLEMFKDVWTPLDELPPAPDGFDNRKMFEFHPDEAKQMLADAGYPNGFTFEVVMRDTGYYVDHMSMAKAYWEKIGVDLEMDVKEYGTFMSIYQKKTHKDSLLCGRWGGEPYSAFCVRTGNMYNWAMINEPTFDDFYDQMTALYFKPRERDAVMKEFNLAIIDNAPYYMLPQGVNYMFWQPWIKNYGGGFQLGLANYYYQKYLWIDQGLKESMGH
jgi:peptide/nickel transport system substrate-binding protein